jgi:predicted membrane-bound spermidine synthase
MSHYGLIVVNNPKNYYRLFLKNHEILANNHKYRFGNSRVFHAIDAMASASG